MPQSTRLPSALFAVMLMAPIAAAAQDAVVASTSAPPNGQQQQQPAGPSVSTPLIVTGKRSHRPTWRGPQGRPLKAPPESWGKAGVSMADYRAEAADCTRKAYNLDVSQTQAADTLKRASTRMEMLNDEANMSTDPAWAYANIAREREQVNYPHLADQLEEMMQRTVEQCLTAYGYRRFRLNAEQRKHLGQLNFGTEARRAYLYSLATDEKVLSAQSE